MPDITMCPSNECLLRTKCYRSPASGTKPNEHRQAWFVGKDTINEECRWYYPTNVVATK